MSETLRPRVQHALGGIRGARDPPRSTCERRYRAACVRAFRARSLPEAAGVLAAARSRWWVRGLVETRSCAAGVAGVDAAGGIAPTPTWPRARRDAERLMLFVESAD